MLSSGDFVLIVRGEDDVSDGQVCKVLAADESAASHRYQVEDFVPVMCWTGYLVWTTQDNLIRITDTHGRIERLFQLGYSRTGSVAVHF